MNDKLMLVADFVEGTWDGVVNAWCEVTGQQALCLVPCDQQATALLFVGKYGHEVQEALKKFEGSALPVVWVNDFSGQVLRFSSISEALQALAMEKAL
jgi:hypothetical protein